MSRADFLPERFRPSPPRRPSPRRLVALILLPALLALVPQWRLQAVEVSPDAPLPDTARQSLAELVDTPIVLLDLDEVHRMVDRWPAVDGCDVTVDLSGTLRVSADGTVAAGSIRRGRGWQALTAAGRPAHRLQDPALPILDGFPLDVAELRRGLAVASRLTSASGAEVERVRRITPSDLEVHAAVGVAEIVVHVGPDGSVAERLWASTARAGTAPAWADARADRRLVVGRWS